MISTILLHDVCGIRVEQKPLISGEGKDHGFTTNVFVKCADGSVSSITLFHASPVEIEGAEFVNFTTQEPA